MDGNNFNNEFGGDYADAVYEAPAQESQGNGFAIASLVLGILGMTCLYGAFIPQILAIVFGKIAKNKGQNNAMAGWGFWLGIVSLVLTLVGWVIVIAIYGAAIIAAIAGAGY